MYIFEGLNHSAGVVYDLQGDEGSDYIELDELPDGDGVLRVSIAENRVWWEPLPDVLTPARQNKLDEISTACNTAIIAGDNVTFMDGTTKFFAYSLEDQTNIGQMFSAVLAGATRYLYHAEGGACMMYTADEIISIYSTLASRKTALLTYHNSLKSYVQSLESVTDIEAVTWGMELPDPYLSDYNELIRQAEQDMADLLLSIKTKVALNAV